MLLISNSRSLITLEIREVIISSTNRFMVGLGFI